MGASSPAPARGEAAMLNHGIHGKHGRRRACRKRRTRALNSVYSVYSVVPKKDRGRWRGLREEAPMAPVMPQALAGALTLLDYAAVAVFGATGALAAARRKHDIVTFGFFAAVTGVGGGTLRDLLIGAPVFWIARPLYPAAALAAALAVWVFGWGRRGERVLVWLDALGMAAYAVVGALKALSLGVPAF